MPITVPITVPIKREAGAVAGIFFGVKKLFLATQLVTAVDITKLVMMNMTVIQNSYPNVVV